MSKKLSGIAIGYFLVGLFFAFYFAWYYHWTPFSYFSPGFWVVIISWPYQAIGLVNDISFYGFSGKPI